ncbi:TRAP-type mannitol/chloroaromatic compound transport system, small permease component [Aliiroseovarius sediminilitoris]|uniref:TRAP transporter small permease protein n=1 Tax=Aliiroseovarius sediminilitoris TaxID=1173584 RepID=A0A1I0NNP0_9RHOB|nr:TRAP transporter small permease [Aliiroseovarius sediminilitoris]SEW02491.1 TRAP-type mannitol/chloroaromatic compound transport system, small permease component [Aliiroseovarius sediminilitoris]
MAGSSLVLSDDSSLSKIDQRLYRLESALALVSGLAVFSLMILAVASVSGRNFFQQPLPGYVDWIEQAMPLIAFMGVAYAQRDGGHIRMDMLVGKLRGRALYLVEIITTLAILIFMILIVWGSWAHFARSFDFAAPMWSRDSSMDIALPLWPAKLLAPVAFSVLCIRLMVQIYAYGRAFVRNDPSPVAVPLVADAATQAALEAQHVSGRDDGTV